MQSVTDRQTDEIIMPIADHTVQYDRKTRLKQNNFKTLYTKPIASTVK